MNLATILDGHPDEALALVHHQRRYSYGELRAIVGRARGALVALGLQPGDRLGLVSGATPRFVISYLAALGAGLVVVPLNPRSPAAELTRELADVTPRALVVGPMGAGVVEQIPPDQRPSVEFLIVPEGTDIAGGICLDTAEFEAPPLIDRSDDDLAVLMFTSGTAGAPKPAMLTHGSLRANLEQMGRSSRTLLADDIVLCPIPLFHIHGLNAVLGPTLRSGATMVLMERFDPVAALDLIVSERATVVSGPPTLWSSLAATPYEGNPMAGVRVGYSGGAALSPHTRKAVHDRFGLWLTEGYGLTESGSALTVAGDDMPSGTVGRPLPGVELRLVDNDGDDVYVGDEGEVWAKGPNIFAGYWNDDDATRRAIDNEGWLHTGDLAVVGDDGLIRLVDRAKDLIVVSGFNVYPGEVEEIIRLHPAVADVAVVGVPHPHQGESVQAYVVPERGHAVEVDALISHCQTHLANYKCPAAVAVVDDIPRTVTGKVRRRDLRSA